MADIAFKITADARQARAEVERLRQTVATETVAINQSFARGLDADVVFRQLTQLRIGFSQLGRGDVGGLPNLIQAYRLAGNAAEELTTRTATNSQVFSILEAELQRTSRGTLTAKDAFDLFKDTLNSAAREGGQAATLFQSLGVNLERGIGNPQRAFREFLTGLSGVDRNSEKFKELENLFGNTASGITNAGQSLAKFEQAETAAAAGATQMAGGLSAATLGIGALVVAALAAVAAVAVFTVKLSEQANELRRTSEVTGLSIEQLQIYDRVAEAAGAKTGALTSVFAKFREETGGNAQHFDELLRSLEAIQNPQERLAIAQARLGKLSDDAARAILELTNNQGQLRKEVEASGLVISSFEAKELARLDQRFERIKIGVEGTLKRALIGTVDALGSVKATLTGGVDGFIAYEKAQQSAAAAARGNTAAINQQVSAVNQLKVALDSLNIDASQKAVSDHFSKIADTISVASKRALTRKEGEALVKQQFDLNPLLKQNADVARIGKANRELIEDIINPTIKPKTGGGAGGFRSALADQRNELRTALDSLKLQEQTASRLAEAEINSARRAFEFRRITSEQLAELVGQAEQTMLAAKKKVFEEERREVEASEKKQLAVRGVTASQREQIAAQSALKIAQINEQEAAAVQRSGEAVRRAMDEALRAQNAVREQASQARASRAEDALRREIEVIQRAANEQIINEETAAKRIAAIESDRFNKRRNELLLEIATTREGSLENQQAKDALARLEQERVAAVEDGNRRIRAARAADTERLRLYVVEQTKLLQSLRQAELENEQAEADALARRAQQTGRQSDRIAAVLRQGQVNEGRAGERNRQNLAGIDADETEALAVARTGEQIQAAIRISHERRLEEERRFQAELAAIRNGTATEAADANSASNLNVFGIGDESLGKFDAFKESAKAAFADVAGSAQNFRQIVGGALGSVLQASQGVLASFILTGKGGGAAFKRLAADVIAALAIQSGVKAIFETAEGFAALGRIPWDPDAPRQAAMHFSAAKIYAVVAGVSAGVGLSVGAAGGLGGDGGASGSNSPTANQLQEQRARELAVARGNPFDQDGRGINETVFDASNGQLAVIQQVGQAVSNALREHLGSMPPGNVVTLGASDARIAIAQATLEHSRTDDGFNSALGRNLLGVT